MTLVMFGTFSRLFNACQQSVSGDTVYLTAFRIKQLHILSQVEH